MPLPGFEHLKIMKKLRKASLLIAQECTFCILFKDILVQASNKGGEEISYRVYIQYSLYFELKAVHFRSIRIDLERRIESENKKRNKNKISKLFLTRI